jgi:hypothetical protein
MKAQKNQREILEDGGRGTEDRGRKSEVGGRRTEDGGRACGRRRLPSSLQPQGNEVPAPLSELEANREAHSSFLFPNF